MTTTNDWNANIVAEFRANGGRVGGRFVTATIVLMHYTGRKSGTEYVTPASALLADDAAPDTIYVFASAGGAPAHPQWYHNLVAAGTASVEIGTPVGIETYAVTVHELHGEERDRRYAQQVARQPGFAAYEEKTKGIRIIPVLALTRVR
ncbi:MAG: hypothetical protein JWM93_3468 [Frankiales bacterium]|nr:hypothetical protein [Frankiales bacterium]